MEIDRGEMGSGAIGVETVEMTTSGSRVHLSVDIPEWLLVEVLIRLPVKLVFRSKLVSKQWLSVISDPCFIRMYISRASNSPNLKRWTYISSALHVDGYHYSDYPEYDLLEDVDSCDLQHPSLYVIRCPFLVHPRVKKYRVAGVSNGLVLYIPRGQLGQCCIYNISNPITRQWITLPPYTRIYENESSCFVTRVENGVLLSYRVVRLEAPFLRTNIIKLEVFYSETKEWKGFNVRTNEKLIQVTRWRNPTAFNGILHWITRWHGIMAYNPYEKPNSLRFIALPHDIDPTCNDEKHNGIPSLCDAHGGYLRYFEVSDVFMPPHGFSSFSVWILSDYSAGKWCLQHRLSSADVVYDCALSRQRLFLEPISFHPFDPDIVFFGYEGILVSYNIRTRKLEAHNGPPNDRITKWQKQPCWWLALLFVIPPWPTAIPNPSFGYS